MVPRRDTAVVSTAERRMMAGGLKVSCALWTYSFAYLEKARFSAPERRIFWMPLISE